MLEEPVRPSLTLIVLTIAPLPLLIATVLLTEGFSISPSLPYTYSRVIPIVITIISMVIAIFAFNLARDEEPEWGPVLPFKVIEGVSIAYLIVGSLFAALIIMTYFIGL